MSKRLIVALAAGGAWLLAASGPQAAPTWPIASEAAGQSIELSIVLGTDKDDLVVTPKDLVLTAGRTYRLTILNPSFTTHYFWAPEFGGQATWTDRISVDSGKARLRMTGAPGEAYTTWEIEIRPGGKAVWEFVPEMAGYFKWGCSDPAHVRAGMEGELFVRAASSGT